MSTQTMGDVIINMRANDVSMSAGFKSIGGQLNDIASKVFSFQGLLRIGLGFQVMRTVFRDIHEGIVKAGEGFNEATRAGESFGDSLVAAGEKMVGLETHAEMVARHLKESAENAKTLGAMLDTLEGLQDKGLIRTPFDKMVDEASKKAQELNKLAAEGKNKLNAIQLNRAEAEANGGETPGHILLAGGNFDEQEAKVKKEYAQKFIDAEQGEENLRKIREAAARAEEEAEDRNADKIYEKEEEEAKKIQEEKLRRIDELNRAERKLAEMQKKDDDERERKNKELFEQMAREEREAKEIIDKSDPLASIRDQATKAEDLFDKGMLTAQQRDKEFARLQRDADTPTSKNARFESLEQMSRSIQENLTKQDKEHLKPSLDEVNTTLKDIRDRLPAGMA